MSTVSISDLGPFIGKVAVDVFFSWAQRLRSLCEYEERREPGGGLPGHLRKKNLTFMQPDKKQQFPVIKNVWFPEKRLKLWSSKIANCQPVDRFFPGRAFTQKSLPNPLFFPSGQLNFEQSLTKHQWIAWSVTFMDLLSVRTRQCFWAGHGASIGFRCSNQAMTHHPKRAPPNCVSGNSTCEWGRVQVDNYKDVLIYFDIIWLTIHILTL